MVYSKVPWSTRWYHGLLNGAMVYSMVVYYLQLDGVVPTKQDGYHSLFDGIMV